LLVSQTLSAAIQSGIEGATNHDKIVWASIMGDAGVNFEVMYSDHDNQLILVVDDIGKARAASREWASEGT
jgi:hypothetical protein